MKKERNCLCQLGWCKTQVMQVEAGQQNAGQTTQVKTSGHEPMGFRLTAVQTKREEGRSMLQFSLVTN